MIAKTTLNKLRAIARAAGTDAANRRMRKRGAKEWSLEDYNHAVKTYYQLCEKQGRQSTPIPHCVNSELV